MMPCFRVLFPFLCFLLLFSACRKKETERLPADRIGGIRLGDRRFPRNGEGCRILLNEILLKDPFAYAYGEVVPFDHRLYAIILVAPEVHSSDAFPEKIVAEQLETRYLLHFQRTPEGFRAEADGVAVTVSRDYRFGPDAVAAEFRSLSLAALAEQAKTTGEFQRLEKRNRAREEILVLEAALRDYHRDTGRYPATLAGLFQPPAAAEGWQGPYLERFSGQDPWGRDYFYFVFPDGQKYELFSKDENGKGFLR